MNILQRWLTHRKTNKLYEQLLEELGPVAKDKKPELVLDKMHEIGGYFSPPELTKSGKPEVHISAKENDIDNSVLSHELAHGTGLAGSRGNKLSKALLGIGYRVAESPTANTALQLSGAGGLSALAQLMMLAEEGQANIRGARALKKVQGKLTNKNKAMYGTSMGSYLLDSGVFGLGFPKAVQQAIDHVSPGFAENNPVLVDLLH